MVNKRIYKLMMAIGMVAFMMAGCEKPKSNEGNPDADSIENATDYREQWEGRYWAEGMSQQRIWILVDSTTSNKMTYRNSANMPTAVPVEVTKEGKFSYHQDSLCYIDGYFFGADSMYVLQKILQHNHVGSVLVETEYFCKKMNPNIPEP